MYYNGLRGESETVNNSPIGIAIAIQWNLSKLDTLGPEFLSIIIIEVSVASSLGLYTVCAARSGLMPQREWCTLHNGLGTRLRCPLLKGTKVA